MRISEFAKKHKTTQDTIRHYLDMGLLISKKDGAHYRFNESDSIEIEKIMELKNLEFSLSQIQQLLCLYRLGGDKTYEYIDFYLYLLEEKKEAIKKKQQKYAKVESNLKDKINELNIDKTNKTRVLGLPMSSMDILRCPNCKGILNIYDGIIEKNMVIKGNVKCECNYNAIIENGIYIDEEFIIENTFNEKDRPSKKEYMETASPKFINFYYDGMSMLIDNIQKYKTKPKYIMELESCAGTFLMQYIKYMAEDTTFIVIDYDIVRLTNLKNNIKSHHKHSNFIFFCCDVDRLPIANSTIDIMVDHWLTKKYAKSNNRFLPEIMAPLLKDRGLFTGTYPYFNLKSKDYHELPAETRDYFNKDKVLERFDNLNLERIHVSDIGPTIESNPYNIDTSDKELFALIYAGQKKK